MAQPENCFFSDGVLFGLMGCPCGSAGDLGSIPGLGRSLGEGKGYPLQYSGLKNPMDCVVSGVAKSGTRLSDFHSLLVLGLGDFFLPLKSQNAQSPHKTLVSLGGSPLYSRMPSS